MPQSSSRPRTSSTSRTSTIWTAVFLVLALLPLGAPASAESDPKAVEIAERSLESMGGAEAWEAARFFRFNFFGFRLHHWDRYTGRHRLEGQNREGNRYVVLHNVLTREGEAFVDGERQTGEQKEQWLENAYKIWINDTYWLLMPYKLRDPGVNLTYDGEETIDGTVYDKLKLTFDGVGVTPGDTYWAYINRNTGLMDRWAYFLQDWDEERSPSPWLWLDWQKFGGIMLSPLRRNPADDSQRALENIAVFDHLPDEVFTSVEMPAIGD